MEVKYINNIEVRYRDGQYMAVGKDGKVFYSRSYEEIEAYCRKQGTPKKRSRLGDVVVLRGGDELELDVILCRNMEEAKKVIDIDVNENLQAGDTLIVADGVNKMTRAYNASLGSIIGRIERATVSRGGNVQWWAIVDGGNIHKSDEYKI